jgi:hypothetical protein
MLPLDVKSLRRSSENEKARIEILLRSKPEDASRHHPIRSCQFGADHKALSAGQDADGIGGSVNPLTKHIAS